MPVITSSVGKITFVETKITFSVADISVLVAKTTFVMVEIIFKEDVITSSVADISYIVVEKLLKWLCTWSLLQWPRSRSQ